MLTCRSKLIRFTLAIVICLPVYADSLFEGIQHYRNGDYKKAHNTWILQAEKEHRLAQYYLSQMYQDGNGVKKNSYTAVYWLKRSAGNGLRIAQYNLGNYYQYGIGVDRDLSTAIKWWLKAANAGFGPAQFNLGSAYQFGLGVPKSQEKAKFWYEEAEKNNIEKAKIRLANLNAFSLEKLPEQVKSQASIPVKKLLIVKKEKSDSKEIQPVSDKTENDHIHWIKSQEKTHYSIQIGTSGTVHQAEALASALENEYQYAIYPFRGKTMVLYAITYGSFESKALAKATVSQLPPSLKNNDPWIMTFSDIRKRLISQ